MELVFPSNEYEHYEKDGKRITVCTMRQKALHTIGLNSSHTGRRLYTRHGKKFYKPYRNYFYGKDKDLDTLVEAGYMERMEEIAHGEKTYTYWFNREGLDWLGEQLGIYIYDEEIIASRVYSPSRESLDNVPNGCSSLQAEIFFDCKAEIPSKEEVMQNTICKLVSMNLFKEDEILVKDIRFEKYANITFDKDIYKNRKVVLDYLQSQNIESIGRFGRWEYYWTHQAFKSGMDCAK